MITKSMLKTELPQTKEGEVVPILALWRNQWTSALPRWQVIYDHYYRSHPEQFEGWIELEPT